MSMGEFIAGRYTSAYNALALGQVADGYRLSHQFFKRLITGDAGAQTPQNAVYQGREQFLAFRLIEAKKAGVAPLVEPYANTPGTPLTLGLIGQLDVGYGESGGTVPGASKAMVLTAVTGTAAHIAGEASFTVNHSVLSEGFPVEVLLAPDLREVPVRMRCYPNASGVFGTVA